MDIHIQLREVRQNKGLTQIFVAKKAGIRNNKLSLFETNGDESKLYYDEFLSLCKVLEVNPNIFIKEV